MHHEEIQLLIEVQQNRLHRMARISTLACMSIDIDAMNEVRESIQYLKSLLEKAE